MNGVLLVDKPSGITSHDVVSKIKRLTREKTGHAGTLDPFATGLLVILIGKATKISDFLINDDKSYEGEAVFGKRTDTMDLTGKFIEEKDASTLNKKKIKEAFKKYTGLITQVPPAYSAVKIKGKKAYELARKGMEVEIAERKVEVRKLELISFKENKSPQVTFKVEVSKGTYIRSLFDDIGSYLNTGAYLKSLRRLASGVFKIEDSIKLDDLLNAPGLLQRKLIPIKNALQLTEVIVKESAKKAILNGVPINIEFLTEGKIPENKTVKVIDSDGTILSVQKTNNGKVTVLMVFKDAGN